MKNAEGKRWATRLGLEFFDVDPGGKEEGRRMNDEVWHANNEPSNSWEYCRQWIDRGEPLFACLLSQRYGWVPEPHHFRDDADRQQQQREPRSIAGRLTTIAGPHEGANHVC